MEIDDEYRRRWVTKYSDKSLIIKSKSNDEYWYKIDSKIKEKANNLTSSWANLRHVFYCSTYITGKCKSSGKL